MMHHENSTMHTAQHWLLDLAWLLDFNLSLDFFCKDFMCFHFHKGVDRTLGGGRLGVVGVPPGGFVDPVDVEVHTAP